MSLIPKAWTVPTKFRERLGDQAGRQRVMVHEGHVLLVLHQVPDEEHSTREAALFWRQPDGTWRSSKHGAGGQAVREHVRTFATTVQQLEQRLEAAEESADTFAVLRASSPLARTSRNLHRVLQEARDACPADRDLIIARDHAGDVERAAQFLNEEARDALSFTVARRAEEQAALSAQAARSHKRLNELAAFFLPFTALAAVAGMKASSVPMVGGVVAGGLVIGLVLRSLVAK